MGPPSEQFKSNFLFQMEVYDKITYAELLQILSKADFPTLDIHKFDEAYRTICVFSRTILNAAKYVNLRGLKSIDYK